MPISNVPLAELENLKVKYKNIPFLNGKVVEVPITVTTDVTYKISADNTNQDSIVSVVESFDVDFNDVTSKIELDPVAQRKLATVRTNVDTLLTTLKRLSTQFNVTQSDLWQFLSSS